MHHMSYGRETAMGKLTTLVVEQLGPAFKRLWPAAYTKKFASLLAEIDLVDEFRRERDRFKIPMV